MSGFGDFTEADTFRLARLIRAKPAQVWAFLTEPVKLATWLAEAAIDLRLGGRVQLAILQKGETPAPEDRMLVRGVITRCDTERVLAYTWRGSMPMPGAAPGAAELETEVAFELSAQGEKTQLVLLHRRLAPDWLVPVACGWHLSIEDLAARVLGQEPLPVAARWQAVMPEYRLRAERLPADKAAGTIR